ncbi:MAG TPA: heme o synthase [Tepidisphaeraceae bacterium]|jgi:protoheme IX farnesyltransferase|nr:heme o synthase [Tepidisphaeraceae bacterium]
MKPVADMPDILNASPLLDDVAEAVVSQRVRSRAVDFYELTKPRMNLLVVITTMVGFYMASFEGVNWLLLVNALFGTTLCAASASVFNQYIEREYDALMPRTRNRPLAAGRLGLGEAMWFGLALGIVGVLHLALFVNVLTAFLGAFTMLSYIFIYTPMKRYSTLNTVVGAVPGAIPPMMGWTAVTNDISIEAAALFGILFLWQMPHFLAIAIMYRKDYEAGGFMMLPSVDPKLSMTSRMIILYTIALIAVSVLPAVLNPVLFGRLYAVSAAVLGFGFLWFGVVCAVHKTRLDARRLFFASIIYLPLILGAMMLDKR